MRQINSRPFFFFFLKAFYEVNACGLQLNFKIVLNLAYNKKKVYKTLSYWSGDMLNVDFSEKGVCGTGFTTTFYVWLSKKNVSYAIFYELTKFHCLVVFTCWDIGQYVYSNGFLTRLWCHKFGINLIFLIKPFFHMTKNSRQKFQYLEKEKSF